MEKEKLFWNKPKGVLKVGDVLYDNTMPLPVDKIPSKVLDGFIKQGFIGAKVEPVKLAETLNKKLLDENEKLKAENEKLKKQDKKPAKEKAADK